MENVLPKSAVNPFDELPQKNEAPVKPVRYCLYARKSTEQDEKQALSIDSQVKEMLDLAKRDGLEVGEIRRESHSAKATGERPEFNRLLDDVRLGKFDGILAWAPDRLSRNAGDLGAVVDLMDQKVLREVRTFGQRFTDNPNEKFLLMILGAQGKLENDQKGINVKRGLRARCEMGLWPAPAPTGYLKNPDRDKKCEVIVDPKRGPVIRKMFEKVAIEKWSGRQLYKWLRNDLNFRTVNGKHLTLSNIYMILKSTFYYGVFEYPSDSGNWYQGKHEPLISKELYERVQEQVGRDDIVRADTKEFAFTKLIKCGLCGSGITADEKFKKQQNGNVHRYVYYGCTKRRDIDCKCGYIREEDLVKEMMKLIDEVNLDDIGIKDRIADEIARYRKFQTGVLGVRARRDKKSTEVDIRNYAKYILREGTVYEKRELLTCLRSRLMLKEKKLTLEEVA